MKVFVMFCRCTTIENIYIVVFTFVHFHSVLKYYYSIYGIVILSFMVNAMKR